MVDFTAAAESKPSQVRHADVSVVAGRIRDSCVGKLTRAKLELVLAGLDTVLGR
jgi:hypothetical protein